jgi:L-asparaginase
MSLNEWSRIHLVTTGGTIEKTYDEREGTLFNRETIIKKRINNKLRLPYTEIVVTSLMAMDSLDMQDSHREEIYNKINELKSENLPIVILHGTDTMQHTAELVESKIGELNAPVVFTGAMKPLGFEDSDAVQNVTEALMAAQLLKPGIYISFHNRVYDVPGVRKNLGFGTFEEF